jgi:hypothetical protein
MQGKRESNREQISQDWFQSKKKKDQVIHETIASNLKLSMRARTIKSADLEHLEEDIQIITKLGRETMPRL